MTPLYVVTAVAVVAAVLLVLGSAVTEETMTMRWQRPTLTPAEPKQCDYDQPHGAHRWPTNLERDSWRYACEGIRCTADAHLWEGASNDTGWACFRCGADWQLDTSPLEVARWLVAEARFWAIWLWQLGEGAGTTPPWQFNDECVWSTSP